MKILFLAVLAASLVAGSRRLAADNNTHRPSDGTTPLHWAAHNNDAALVDQLLKAGADANAKNEFGATPMSEAAFNANTEIIDKLLKAGADPDSPVRRRPDRADDDRAHQQRRRGQAPARARRARQRERKAEGSDRADVGVRAEARARW